MQSLLESPKESTRERFELGICVAATLRNWNLRGCHIVELEFVRTPPCGIRICVNAKLSEDFSQELSIEFSQDFFKELSKESFK